jgi:small subunit ribosomal protein S9
LTVEREENEETTAPAETPEVAAASQSEDEQVEAVSTPQDPESPPQETGAEGNEADSAEGAEAESAEAQAEAGADSERTETADGEVPEAAEAPPPILGLAADARYSATGKRKTSVARVILRPGNGSFELNGRSLAEYFPRRTLQQVVQQPLAATGYVERVDIRARIHGGGISSQADALRHGIAKALIEADPNLRGELKRRQLLTRDPRVKERRKAGLKKARKRPQFSKR